MPFTVGELELIFEAFMPNEARMRRSKKGGDGCKGREKGAGKGVEKGACRFVM